MSTRRASNAAPPGPRRVQRIVSETMPVLHLEPRIPEGDWPLVIDGLVEQPVQICMADIRRRTPTVRHTDLHCVWGWSKPACRWEGVTLDALAEPPPAARFVLVTARESAYAACFTIDDARQGILAWALDGEELPRRHGGPLRFAPPAHKWAYKAVKWVERITFLEHFEPGFWEQRVGDPEGTIPWEVLAQFEMQTETWRTRP